MWEWLRGGYAYFSEWFRDHWMYVLGALFLAACLVFMIVVYIDHIPVLTVGTVVDRIHNGSYMSNTTTYVKSGDVIIPVTTSSKHDEEFKVVVEGVTDKGKQRREQWKVTSFQFGEFVEGETVYRNAKTGQVIRTGGR